MRNKLKLTISVELPTTNGQFAKEVDIRDVLNYVVVSVAEHRASGDLHPYDMKKITDSFDNDIGFWVVK